MKPHSLALRSLTVADHPAVARLLHHSLVSWYESRLGQGARFGDSPTPFLLFPEVYAALDPGHALAAWEGGATLQERVQGDPVVSKALSDEEISEVFSLKRHLREVDRILTRALV